MMFPVVAESETVQHLQPGLHFQRDKTSTRPLIKVQPFLEKSLARNHLWTKGKSELLFPALVPSVSSFCFGAHVKLETREMFNDEPCGYFSENVKTEMYFLNVT